MSIHLPAILDSNWILSNRLHRIRLQRERSIVFHFNKVTFNLPSIAKRRPICENCRSVAVVQLERPMFGRRIDTQVLRMRSVLQMRLQAIRQWFGGVNCFQLKLSNWNFPSGKSARRCLNDCKTPTKSREVLLIYTFDMHHGTTNVVASSFHSVMRRSNHIAFCRSCERSSEDSELKNLKVHFTMNRKHSAGRVYHLPRHQEPTSKRLEEMLAIDAKSINGFLICHKQERTFINQFF